MRITDDCVRAHLNQRIHEVHTPLEHLLEEEDRTFALRREDKKRTHHVSRKLRPGAVIDRRNSAARVRLDFWRLSGWQYYAVALDLELDTEPLEDTIHHPIMTAHGVVNRDAAAGRGGEREIRTDFNMIGDNAMGRAVQSLDACHSQRICVEALDIRAHADEK